MTIWYNKTAVTGLSSGDKLLCEQSDVSKTCTIDDIDAYVEGILAERVYAYISTPADTVITLPDRWYFLNGIFTNEFASGFTAGADGITYTGTGGYFEVDHMTGGNTDKSALLKIGLVKNGTFVDGLLDSCDNILSGSGGLDEVTTIAGASGFGNLRGFWQGQLEENDKLAIVISSDTASTTWTPLGGSASLHRS